MCIICVVKIKGHMCGSFVQEYLLTTTAQWEPDSQVFEPNMLPSHPLYHQFEGAYLGTIFSLFATKPLRGLIR